MGTAFQELFDRGKEVGVKEGIEIGVKEGKEIGVKEGEEKEKWKFALSCLTFLFACLTFPCPLFSRGFNLITM